MNSQMLETNYPVLNLATLLLSIVRKVHRLIVFFLFLLFFFLPVLVQAASQPGAQKFVNPDFEQGTMNGWAWQGSGWAGVENCCGQHNTPFWGTGSNPYSDFWPNAYGVNTWDGSVSPAAGGDTQLYQYVQVNQGQKYRLNSWVQTSGLTAYLRRYAASLGGLVVCSSTTDTAHTPLSCEFTAGSTELMAFILEQGYGTSGQWADSDDWTLTPIITVPRDMFADTWATLPVPYYVDSWAYPTRTDIAAWSWNNAMGKQMLQRTGNANQPNIIKVVGRWYPDQTWWAQTSRRKDANGVKLIELNKYWMDKFNSSTYRYGFEAREGTIAHEFGHAFGLGHVQNECQTMNAYGKPGIWNCAAFKPTSGDVDGMRSIYPD